MPPPPPPLPEELLEEIFLRLPPDEPACLVRASLTSKLWLGLLTGPAFRGRYREFHGSPPMLGFLLSWLPNLNQERHPFPHFVSPSKFGARIHDRYDWGNGEYDWCPWEFDSLDCRHGRVLLADTSRGFRIKLAVWDPMTGCRRLLDPPDNFIDLGAAVLCAVTGCDHSACHDGPFRVLLFGFSLYDAGSGQSPAHAWVYSSETDEWSEPCSALQLGSRNSFIDTRPSVLFENSLYHTVLYSDHTAILKYDMGSNCMSLLDGPPVVLAAPSAILMTMDDGSLGFAYLDGSTLCRWSRLICSDGVAAWTQRRVVDFEEFLPIQNPKERLGLIGFKENSDIIFVTTDLGIYEVNLKSLEWKKLWKRAKIRALIPYISFYNRPERGTPVYGSALTTHG